MGSEVTPIDGEKVHVYPRDSEYLQGRGSENIDVGLR
jgi:hypothetical protein